VEKSDYQTTVAPKIFDQTEFKCVASRSDFLRSDISRLKFVRNIQLYAEHIASLPAPSYLSSPQESRDPSKTLSQGAGHECYRIQSPRKRIFDSGAIRTLAYEVEQILILPP
jgi:hypothetical protein